MSLKFNNIGKSGGGATLHYNGKVVSKVHYGGVLVYQNSLPAGTVLFDTLTNLGKTLPAKSTTIKLQKVKPNFTNLKTGLRIYWLSSINLPAESVNDLNIKDIMSSGGVNVLRSDRTNMFNVHGIAETNELVLLPNYTNIGLTKIESL